MLDADPLWYKDAVIYQLHVRAYQDSGSDGIGDFKGLTARLDYLADLGVTTLWLLPFYPSPLRDDGYDIADYSGVNPQYGNLKDFKEFLDEAHKRGLRVVTELVINHTSDQHPWFQRARRAPKGSPERDFYVWSDAPDKYLDARIIFKDFERSNWSYDPVAGAYFWHRFYSHQPDLNFDNPAVFAALTPLLDQWMELGVDGMRLDAIPYLIEREGTNCENLPETHVILKRFRAHMDAKHPGRMFLAEANQWPEDAIAYFGDGDECNMAFHFPLMPRLYMALHQEDRFPIIDILEQTPAIPPNCQWCMFLRNHDELTLEMVTDEERDTMYRAYATDTQARINLGIRRRLAPLLKNDRRQIELMNALLFSMPGTPVVYYGDEIGMGDNIYLGDRNGVRTPMQWSGDRNAGFSRANPQKLFFPVIIDPEYHYETVNVEAQQGNPSSLLWWMKRLIALRKQYQAFGRGTIEFLRPENPKILAFVRRYDTERILVVANLSRFVQYVQLDLSEFEGQSPRELFGRTKFPPVGELPYLLTVGPHGFLWFSLEQAELHSGVLTNRPRQAAVPRMAVEKGWEEILGPAHREGLEKALRGYLSETVIHHGHRRTVRDLSVRHALHLPLEVPTALLLIDAEFLEGGTESRAVRLGYAPPEERERVAPGGVVAELVRGRSDAGVLFDARTDRGFAVELLRAIADNRSLPFSGGELVAQHFPALEGETLDELPEPISFVRGQQHDLSTIYGGKYILKSFERLEPGVHPAVEVGQFLTNEAGFTKTARVLGVLELDPPESAEHVAMAVLYEYVPHETGAWQHTQNILSRFYETVAAQNRPAPAPAPRRAWQPGEPLAPAEPGDELFHAYLRTAEILGRNTAEMHKALATGTTATLAPEPFGKLYQRSLYQGMRGKAGLVFRELARRRARLPEAIRPLIDAVLERQSFLTERFQTVLNPALTGKRIRTHGDYHLGEFLFTGSDLYLVDYEGDPDRPLTERRIKRSALKDVAEMARSFQYAAESPLYGLEVGTAHFPGRLRPEDMERLRGWARFWHSWVAAYFVQAYFAAMNGSDLLPNDPALCRELLEALTLERAVSELGAELEHRREWVPVPLAGLHELLEVIAGE